VLHHQIAGNSPGFLAHQAGGKIKENKKKKNFFFLLLFFLFPVFSRKKKKKKVRVGLEQAREE
jgi:hypothetical protein